MNPIEQTQQMVADLRSYATNDDIAGLVNILEQHPEGSTIYNNVILNQYINMFRLAIENHHMDFVEYLIETFHSNFAATHPNEVTHAVLYHACRNHQYQVAQQLLGRRLNVNNTVTVYPYHNANDYLLMNIIKDGNSRALEFLINAGVDLGVVSLNPNTLNKNAYEIAVMWNNRTRELAPTIRNELNERANRQMEVRRQHTDILGAELRTRSNQSTTTENNGNPLIENSMFRPNSVGQNTVSSSNALTQPTLRLNR